MRDAELPSPFHVALSLAGRSVLVIGGGEEAEDKLPKLRAAGARVTLVAPEATLILQREAKLGAISWFARAFYPSDLTGVTLVLLTEVDPQAAQALRALKSLYPFWLCAVDQPTYSDLFLVSSFSRGPVQVAVSTSGKAPLLARRLRQSFERGLDETFTDFARKFAELRARLRTLPKERRKEQLSAALNGFAIELRVSYPAGNPFGEDPPDGAGRLP